MLATPDELPRGTFDVIFSRIVNEHVADGERYYRNIFDALRPGGVTAHCFSTLYALPFVVNRLLPERLAGRMLDRFHPRDRHQHEKFRARYSWSRGPTRRMRARLSALGYEVVEYRGSFGHAYYEHALRPLQPWRRPGQAGCAGIRCHSSPAMRSWMLRKPR